MRRELSENGEAVLEAAPAANRVADALRRQIMEGRYAPGDPMRDTALAAAFGVSRNTVRDALRRLDHEGLVTYQMHKGTVVKTLDADDVRDIYALRRALELRAIEESAVASEQRLADLESAVTAAERALRAGEWNAAGTASLVFHQALVALLGSRRLDDFFRAVLAQVRLAFAEVRDEAEFQVPWIPRDREICELVLSGRRNEAASAMRWYLDEAERMVVDVVRARRSSGGRSPR
jgi:DNA-binding GntR family transcriptional regulator